MYIIYIYMPCEAGDIYVKLPDCGPPSIESSSIETRRVETCLEHGVGLSLLYTDHFSTLSAMSQVRLWRGLGACSSAGAPKLRVADRGPQSSFKIIPPPKKNNLLIFAHKLMFVNQRLMVYIFSLRTFKPQLGK